MGGGPPAIFGRTRPFLRAVPYVPSVCGVVCAPFCVQCRMCHSVCGVVCDICVRIAVCVSLCCVRSPLFLQNSALFYILRALCTVIMRRRAAYYIFEFKAARPP